MKKIYITSKNLLTALALLLALAASSQELPKFLHNIEKIKLETGEIYQLPLELDYVVGVETGDTTAFTVQWSVSPDSLGTFDEYAVFTAEKEGEGYVYLSDSTSAIDSVEIEIEKAEDENDDMEFPKLLLDINKIKLDTGEIYQFPLMLDYVESAGSDTVKVTVQWSAVPNSLGTFDEYAVFTAKKTGEGYIYASYNNTVDSLEIEIETDDDEDIDDDEYPKVKIVPGSIRVEVGDSVELYAFYIDSSDVKADTSYMWSVHPMELGEFTDPANSMFYAGDTPGQGTIIARLLDGDLTDTVKITVYESKWKKEKKEKEKNSNGNNGKQLTIDPGDMVVYAGAGPIDYSATYKTNGNKHQNADFMWSISDTSIATIDTDGLLTLKGETGMTLVSVEYSNFGASVELLVIDSMIDMDVNTIAIHRVLPNGKELKAKTFKEGDSYKIGGLPYPLNILNGGSLHFPFGCIDEDVTIYMFIPEKYAEINEDSTEVNFSEEIITGVKFSVMPASSDTIVEPFWFNIPVELKLIYKQELLDSLGIDPENLDVFFADNAGFVEVEPGKVATVDSARNRIYASIEHFSTLVVREKSATTNVKELQPLSEDKMDIYPNPTNSSTTVQFRLAEAGDVNITVYNLLGQKVQILVEDEFPEGLHKVRWQGTDQSGSPAPSGLYFCRFVKNGNMTDIKRIVLNR